MADEIVDYFDSNYKNIGKGLKSHAQQNGIFIHSFHCWILNTAKEWSVLFQKRGSEKKVFPNCLDISAAGHLKSGESVLDGRREIKEELRIDVDPNELISLGIKIDIGDVGKAQIREFCNTYLLLRPGEPNKYYPDLDEVEGLVEIKIDDGLELFSGERESVLASGIEFNKSTNTWEDISIQVSKEMFIPRIDSYYYKVFIMAERIRNGNHRVTI